ncbi:MAG: hypothetical protein JWM93_1404 [Frankiales bacterium]|nr:hypothetical protein [Frankiales bacterium]
MALTVKQVGAGIAHLPPLAPVEVPRNRYATVPPGNVRVIPVDRDADAVEAIIDGVCLPTGHDLAKLNGIRDPTRLSRGQRVRLS